MTAPSILLTSSGAILTRADLRRLHRKTLPSSTPGLMLSATPVLGSQPAYTEIQCTAQIFSRRPTTVSEHEINSRFVTALTPSPATTRGEQEVLAPSPRPRI